MNILEIIFLIATAILNLLIIFSLITGFKGIEDKVSRMGLKSLLVCLIADILGIIGGVVIW